MLLQYSVTTHFRPAVIRGIRQNLLPGVFFIYDFSPFQVRVETRQKGIIEFITGLCAILGGLSAVSGLLERAIQGIIEYRSSRAVQRSSGTASPTPPLWTGAGKGD